MTSRGRAILALGVLVYAVAWVFGSRALFPVATGLLLAVAAASAWVRLSARPPYVRRWGAARDLLEGDDIAVRLELESTGAVSPPTLVAVERAGRLAERAVHLRRVEFRKFVGAYRLPSVPRGRYTFEPVRIRIEDPFGLARAELTQGEPQALVVFPRLVSLDTLFSEGGAHAQDGRRLLLRRPTGFELHSVREHVEGESLRGVHWPTTARRGRLMVKELEDAPRDELVVLLDADAAVTSGERFDVAVRAAGSILRTHVDRSRRSALVINSAMRETVSVVTDGDWARALEALAGAEANGHAPVYGLLQADGGIAARALELVVVTSGVNAGLADRLVQRQLSRRGTALVYVASSRDPEPLLLRLQSVGIPVAVVHPGDDLRTALSQPEARVA